MLAKIYCANISFVQEWLSRVALVAELIRSKLAVAAAAAIFRRHFSQVADES